MKCFNNQLNRRKFLQHSSLSLAALSSLSLLSPPQLFAQGKGVFKDKLVQSMPQSSAMVHLINRTSFGVSPYEIELYQNLGYEGYIDEQLNADVANDAEIEALIAQMLPTVNMSSAEIKRLVNNDELNQFAAADELKIATLLRAIYSKNQLLQVMVEFWNNHFSIYHFDGPNKFLKTAEDREVIRPLALQTFSQLLQADAKSPAMIYYLDTFSSDKDAPNENYARELMELHTLSVDGPYSHHDIDEVARCFTGWKINRNTGLFRFVDNAHDFEEKTVLGHRIAAGGGLEDGQQVLAILAAHDSTAQFIAKKLCVHFISDEPAADIVDSTAQVFRQSNGDIKAIVKHILMSKNFQMAVDTKLKRPFHFVASTFRSLKTPVFNKRIAKAVNKLLRNLGQAPFDWPTPDGYPDYAGHWLSTSGLLLRWNFVNLFVFDEYRGLNFSVQELFTAPFTPQTVMDDIEQRIVFRELATTDRQALLQFMHEELVDGEVPLSKIQATLAIVLNSAYYQLI